MRGEKKRRPGRSESISYATCSTHVTEALLVLKFSYKSCCTSLLATVTTTLINTTLYRVLGWQAGKWICILFPWLTAVCRNRINLCFLLSVMTQKSTCVTFNRWNEITTFVSLPLPKFYMKLDYLSSQIITQILRSVRVSRYHSPSLKRSKK